MLDSDVLYGFRLRLFDHAREVGVSRACRTFGVHRSTYYRWKAMVERSGLEMLRPRERRSPRMPNQTNPVVEARVLAFAIAHPGLGPRGSAPAWPRSAGAASSSATPASGASCAGTASPAASAASPSWPAMRPRPGPRPVEPEPERHIEVDHPGELVGFDCFHVGRLSGTSGAGLAVHRHRPRHELGLGRAAHDAAQPRRAQHEPPGAAGRGRPGGPRLAPRAGPHRQRLGVPLVRLRGHPPRARAPSRRSSTRADR